MRIIRKAAFRRGLWRNGRGVSWDIVTEPSTSGHEFGWRLTTAEIAESGPFSLYGPVDRVFILIEGKGLDLEVGEDRLHIPDLFAPRNFACDVKTVCTLIDGPCRALNLLTARGEWRAAAETVLIEEIEDIDPRGSLCAIFVLKGECSIATHGMVEVAAEGDALIAPQGTGPLSAAGNQTTLFVARLTKSDFA